MALREYQSGYEQFHVFVDIFGVLQYAVGGVAALGAM